MNTSKIIEKLNAINKEIEQQQEYIASLKKEHKELYDSVKDFNVSFETTDDAIKRLHKLNTLHTAAVKQLSNLVSKQGELNTLILSQQHNH